MTPEECAELSRVAAIGTKRVHAKRTAEEKRRFARRAAMARYNRTSVKATTQNSATNEAVAPKPETNPAEIGTPAAPPEEITGLKEAVDQLGDSLLTELYSALAARFGV